MACCEQVPVRDAWMEYLPAQECDGNAHRCYQSVSLYIDCIFDCNVSLGGRCLISFRVLSNCK